jgi:hypothetical protein
MPKGLRVIEAVNLNETYEGVLPPMAGMVLTSARG